MMSYAEWGNQLYSGKKSYPIVKHSRVFLIIAGLITILSVVLVGFRGLNPSIEFTGGTQFIVTQTNDPAEKTAQDALKSFSVGETPRVSTLGADSVRVQTGTLSTEDTTHLRAKLAEAYAVPLDDVQTNSVGGTWGQDVTRKALQSIGIFVALVAVLMTLYFRSWTMSGAALISLANDLLVTVGFFALTHVEVSPATVIGFLTILGYSLYDTVVVFDKVREITHGAADQDRYTFGELVNLGVNQTLVRSINTSVVALLPVGSILFIGSLLLGAGTLTDISLALFVGMLVGALSSIFVASPALAMMEGRRAKMKEHDAKVLERRGSDEGSAAGVPAPVVVAPKTPGKRLPNQEQPRRKNRRKK